MKGPTRSDGSGAFQDGGYLSELPCLVRFPCVHAVATTPAQRLDVSLRSFHPDVAAFLR
jgi:hypothetical protein